MPASIVALLLVSSVPSVTLATTYCNGDRGIWVIQKFPNGYGSWSEIQKVNDSLSACTSGSGNGKAFAVHTAGVAFSLSGSTFIEVGLYRNVSGGTIRNRVFGEFGFYPDVYGPFFYDTYNPDGLTVDMKVTNIPGTWNWKLYWDKSGGGLNWILLDQFNGMSAQKGWAWGEHARMGRTGTGGFDHHWDMQFKNGGGNWQDIDSLVCWIDSDADMKWVDISDTEFKVIEGDRACEPHI